MKRYFQRSCSFSQSWQSSWPSSKRDFSFYLFQTLHLTQSHKCSFEKNRKQKINKILLALNLEIWVQKRIPAPRSWVWVPSSAWVLLASSHGPKTWFWGAERVSVCVVCLRISALRGGYTHKLCTSSTTAPSALLAASRTFPVICSTWTSIAAPPGREAEPETDRFSPTTAVPAPHNNNNNNNNCWGQELLMESIREFHMMLHFVFPSFCIRINRVMDRKAVSEEAAWTLKSQLGEKSNKYMETCCCCVCCSFLMLCFYVKLYYWDDLVSLCASVSRFDSPHKYTHTQKYTT